jgi:hypothetical protein
MKPTLIPGFKFGNRYMEDCNFEVLEVNGENMTVRISRNDGSDSWIESWWNVEHSLAAFECGEYYRITPVPKPNSTTAERRE